LFKKSKISLNEANLSELIKRFIDGEEVTIMKRDVEIGVLHPIETYESLECIIKRIVEFKSKLPSSDFLSLRQILNNMNALD
jgi:antitoxin (DNA-binding transcriptional repressor) of toxin-antitoxin stability system